MKGCAPSLDLIGSEGSGQFGNGLLPPFSLLRDLSFQNTSEHFAICFRQSYLIWEVCDVTAIELSSKE